MIDLLENALDASAAAGNVMMNGKLAGATRVDSTHGDLTQHLDIRAEFPNATDQNEIREAILGLANYATQFVHKR